MSILLLILIATNSHARKVERRGGEGRVEELKEKWSGMLTMGSGATHHV